MSRTAGRAPAQTRQMILDATADVVRARGVGATLDEIAESAGVSKGGVIYHFGSKDALLLALAESLLDAFRFEVMTAVGSDDTAPGRLTRAYLQVSFDPGIDHRTVRDHLVLIAQLTTDPAIAALAAADSARWAAELADDGLPAEIRDLVVAAADGVGMAALWGDLDREAHSGLHDRLRAVTLRPELWPALSQPDSPGAPSAAGPPSADRHPAASA